MSPRTAQKRLQFVHLVWLIFMAVALGIGLLRGIPASLLLLGGLLAALPAILGLILIRTDEETSNFAKAISVIAWTVLGVVAVSVTGAAVSPLVVLLLMAPLIALLLGEVRMSVEAAVFGCLAYFAAALLGQLGILPPALAAFAPITSAVTLAALMTSGYLVWSLVKEITAFASISSRPDESAAAGTVSRVPAGAAVAELPKGAGLLMLQVSAEGRVRGATGDPMGLDHVYPGAALTDLFAPGADLSALPVTGSSLTGELELANGRRVRFFADKHDRGTRLLLQDQTSAAKAAEEAEARVKQRTEFFASLGHDLRTPLNAILGYADMMRAEIRGPMPEAYADYPDIIHESGSDLMLMVDDILDLAKADADRHRLEPEPVDITEVARSVIRQLQNQADRAGILLQLHHEEEVWAEADVRAVRQIWQNLISNAIKFSSRGGTVSIDTLVTGTSAILRVKDDGAGMSEDELSTITQPFMQGASGRSHKGTGLGLAVVRSFAELHSGQLVIKSKVGKGTDIKVSLPLADPADIVPLEDAAE